MTRSRDPGTVSLVITAHDYARFLDDAIRSARAQSVPFAQIIVVDDGSNDAPEDVARQHPVEFLRLEHAGVSAARSAGLERVRTPFVTFLDADDLLLPDAVAHGLAAMQSNPGAAFVYGAYRMVDSKGAPLGSAILKRVGPLGHHELLRDNLVAMHGAVLYDREKLAALGGFDPEVEMCEDYDAYLRLARRHRIASHPGLVAEYRQHGANMSLDAARMLEWQMRVVERNRPESHDVAAMAAWEEGRSSWRKIFPGSVWKERGASARTRWEHRSQMMKLEPRNTLLAGLRQLAINALPTPVADTLRRLRRSARAPRSGRVDFGDLARIKPISASYGFDRGTPLDRYYIERFLQQNAGAIGSRVMEVGSDAYSRQFGRDIAQQDVLDISPNNRGATIVGDIADSATLPAEAFDCTIVVQTLQFVYDPKAAIANLHAALRPGGVALVTMPGLTPLAEESWPWYWMLTPQAASRLFGEVFGQGDVEVESFGNAFSATCFLQGISLEEVGESWLENDDPAYPVIIAVKARRAA